MSGCCSQSARPLLWKTLFRVIAFSVLAASGGLIFAAVEHPNAVNNLKRKEELLVSLREGMAKKYNMSQDDFDNFIEITDDAFNMAGPSWSYFQSVRFAFETLTTIGKPNLECFTKKKMLFNALGDHGRPWFNFPSACLSFVPRVSHLFSSLAPGGRKDERPRERRLLQNLLASYPQTIVGISFEWIKSLLSGGGKGRAFPLNSRYPIPCPKPGQFKLVHQTNK